uniref:Protein N-terminal glutamine amidohydrolase n=1 Tax=Ascaris lumbricoides TaxID=6252 RepID=A0A0M3IXW5_ASCLU
MNATTLAVLSQFLENAFKSSNDSDSLLMTIRVFTQEVEDYFKCAVLDRVVIVSDEKEMVDRAMCLMDYQQYFSGIYFVDLDANATHFPPVVQYKIRHPPHFVDGM